MNLVVRNDRRGLLQPTERERPRVREPPACCDLRLDQVLGDLQKIRQRKREKALELILRLTLDEQLLRILDFELHAPLDRRDGSQGRGAGVLGSWRGRPGGRSQSCDDPRRARCPTSAACIVGRDVSHRVVLDGAPRRAPTSPRGPLWRAPLVRLVALAICAERVRPTRRVVRTTTSTSAASIEGRLALPAGELQRAPLLHAP
mmetsp:Transcript_73590/g.213159  ORF Transcript_73590/g.213159 Transcript_73590/m.213159 type:complete len:203 (+) Transcript_73590:954-1562(+)